MSYVSSDRQGLWGLGSSTPEIEAKVNQFLNQLASSVKFQVVAGGLIWSGFDYNLLCAAAPHFNENEKPFEDSPIDLRPWINAQTQCEAFLIQSGYEPLASRHIAALMALGTLIPIPTVAPFNFGATRDKWIHFHGESPISHAFNPRDVEVYKTLRENVLSKISWVTYAKTVAPNIVLYRVSPSLGDIRGTRVESKNAYASMLDFVWQAIVGALRTSARGGENLEMWKGWILTAYRDLLGRTDPPSQGEIDAQIQGIRANMWSEATFREAIWNQPECFAFRTGKFYTAWLTKAFNDFLGRAPSASEIGAESASIHKNHWTEDQYRLALSGVPEAIAYKKANPDKTDGKKKESAVADVLKSPWIWVAAAAAGGLYYWTQVKNKSMGQLPYVGKYLKGR